MSGRACDVLEVPLPLSQATRVRLPHPHIFGWESTKKVYGSASIIIHHQHIFIFTFTREIIRAQVPTTYDT